MNLASHALVPALVLASAAPVLGDGSELLGTPSIPIVQTGRAAFAGTGLFSQPGSISTRLPTDATVTQVLAYWDGLDAPFDGQGATDTILLGGLAVSGERIGGPTNFFDSYFVSSYRADVTSLGLVGGGETSLTVEGLDFTYANNGLALVIVTDDDRTLEVRDGLDYAQEKFAAPYDQTEPVVYSFDATNAGREASVSVLVGGVADRRPSVIEVRVDGVLTVEAVDLMSGNLGAQFDAHTFDFEVPAGASEVSVRVLSEDRGGQYTGYQPASLTWLYSSLSLEAADAPSYGCAPSFWRHDWWRWDPWTPADNVTTSVVLTDRFNQTFRVHSAESGVWDHARLWHALRGRNLSSSLLHGRLNREAVAALANADSQIGYPYTLEEVITLYRDAVDAAPGDETVARALWKLYDANRQGCPW
jgi:hypothetical protein